MKAAKFLAIAVAALSVSVGAAADAQPASVAPAATPFKIGDFQLIALRDKLFVVPNNNKVFGLGQTPEPVAAVLKAAGAPTDTISLGVDTLLLEMPGHFVLLDTGLGPKAGGVLMESLAEAGVTPDMVTDILITHSHGDHIGGLLTADGKSAFPRATIRMSQAEWDWFKAMPQSSATVAAIGSQVMPFTPGKPVLPGVTPIALPGHTPGHVGYQIVSNRKRVMDIGDTAHSSIISLARPDWPIQFDTDKARGEATREALLKQLASDHELIFAPHFPYPGVGHVVAKGQGYAFVPGLK